MFRRKDGHSIFSIRHKGNNVFTHARKGVTEVLVKNPGLGAALGTILGAAGGPAGALVGSVIGSVADAGAQDSQTRHDKRAAEQKIEEKQQQVQSQINTAQQQDLNQLASARGTLDAEQQQVDSAGQNLHAEATAQADALNLQKRFVNEILDCCDTNRRQLEGSVNRRLDGIPALLSQLTEAGRELLGNRVFACAHADDRARILTMMEQAQQRAEEPRPFSAPEPARAAV